MNLHDGKTGRSIREERNHEINKSNHLQRMRRKARYHKFPRLKGSPNPMAHRNAIWRYRKGVSA